MHFSYKREGMITTTLKVLSITYTKWHYNGYPENHIHLASFELELSYRQLVAGIDTT